MTDWADAVADTFVALVNDSAREDRPMVVKIIATQLRTIKARAQSEAIITATDEMKKVFHEHGIGGGDK